MIRSTSRLLDGTQILKCHHGVDVERCAICEGRKDMPQQSPAIAQVSNIGACLSSKHPDWETPPDLLEKLNREFQFTFDPCSAGQTNFDGLLRSWVGERVYCNPPYGPGIRNWLAKAREADLAVFLLPARTDVGWFHNHCWNKPDVEIRYIKGRLKFGQSKNSAPFPSMLVIFRKPKLEAAA